MKRGEHKQLPPARTIRQMPPERVRQYLAWARGSAPLHNRREIGIWMAWLNTGSHRLVRHCGCGSWYISQRKQSGGVKDGYGLCPRCRKAWLGTQHRKSAGPQRAAVRWVKERLRMRGDQIPEVCSVARCRRAGTMVVPDPKTRKFFVILCDFHRHARRANKVRLRLK